MSKILKIMLVCMFSVMTVLPGTKTYLLKKSAPPAPPLSAEMLVWYKKLAERNKKYGITSVVPDEIDEIHDWWGPYTIMPLCPGCESDCVTSDSIPPRCKRCESKLPKRGAAIAACLFEEKIITS